MTRFKASKCRYVSKVGKTGYNYLSTNVVLSIKNVMAACLYKEIFHRFVTCAGYLLICPTHFHISLVLI